jgi:hypothetical protein
MATEKAPGNQENQGLEKGGHDESCEECHASRITGPFIALPSALLQFNVD